MYRRSEAYAKREYSQRAKIVILKWLTKKVVNIGNLKKSNTVVTKGGKLLHFQDANNVAGA